MRANTDITSIYVELHRVVSLEVQMEPRMGLPRYLKGEIICFVKCEPFTTTIARHKSWKYDL